MSKSRAFFSSDKGEKCIYTCERHTYNSVKEIGCLQVFPGGTVRETLARVCLPRFRGARAHAEIVRKRA